MLDPNEFLSILRGDPGPHTPQLLLGAQFFRIGLVVLAALCIALPRLPLWQKGGSGATQDSGGAERTTLAVLGGILLAALGLRLYGLESGPWLDEVLTEVEYMPMSFGQNVTTFDSQNQHFIYSLLAHASGQLLGYSVWVSRLPAALFGVASIWALYLLARQVVGRREAILGAALLTFSYQHIWYSQTARGYSGLLFWSLLSSYLLLRALRERRPSMWLLYAVSVGLGTYTHLTMLFVVAGQFVVYAVFLVRQGREVALANFWPGLVLGFGLGGVLVLQLYALVLPQFLGGTLDEQSVVEEWKSPIWTLLETARNLETGLSGGPVVLLAVLLVLGLGLASFALQRDGWIVLTLLFVPVGLCAAVNIGLGHHLWPRFFFFAAGFGVLVVVRGVMALGELGARAVGRPGWSVWASTALCVAAIIASARSIPTAYLPKQDYAGALAFVDANQQPGDVVTMVGLAVSPYRDLYRVDWQEVKTAQQLDTVSAQAHRTWIVYTLPEVLSSVSPDVMDDIQRQYQVVQQFGGTLDDGTVYVARRG
jgi:4-amino-4-deoxy-L-arabinose transferase-like glycosyltransferase